MSRPPLDVVALLTPREVARLFHVNEKTVTRWAQAGNLRVATRTLGNHRRYNETEVRALLNPEQPT